LEWILRRSVSGPAAVVTILTTSGSRYVSGCVTETIEKVCTHGREFTPATEVALVIHEWGFPHPGLDGIAERCRERGAVLVEDSAYAVGTHLCGRTVGHHGAYHFFSLPKFFSVEGGGVLLDREGAEAGAPLPEILAEEPGIVAARRSEVWGWYEAAFETEGTWTPRGGTVPGVFLLPEPDGGEFIRDRLRAARVECGFWYGNDSLFLPCHHRLGRGDVERIRDLVVRFREEWHERAV
jgi:hypothetical protein